MNQTVQQPQELTAYVIRSKVNNHLFDVVICNHDNSLRQFIIRGASFEDASEFVKAYNKD